MVATLVFALPILAAVAAFATRRRPALQSGAIALLASLQLVLALATESSSGRLDISGNTWPGIALILVGPWVVVMAVTAGLTTILRARRPGSWVPSALIPIEYWLGLGFCIVAALTLDGSYTEPTGA